MPVMPTGGHTRLTTQRGEVLGLRWVELDVVQSRLRKIDFSRPWCKSLCECHVLPSTV